MKQLLTPSHPSTSKTSRGSWRCATDVRKYSHNFFMLPDVSWQPVTPRPREPARGQEVNTWGPSRQLIMKCGSNRSGPPAGDARTQSRPLRIIPANSPPAAPPVSPPGKSPLFMTAVAQSRKMCGSRESKVLSYLSVHAEGARGDARDQPRPRCRNLTFNNRTILIHTANERKVAHMNNDLAHAACNVMFAILQPSGPSVNVANLHNIPKEPNLGLDRLYPESCLSCPELLI